MKKIVFMDAVIANVNKICDKQTFQVPFVRENSNGSNKSNHDICIFLTNLDRILFTKIILNLQNT